MTVRAYGIERRVFGRRRSCIHATLLVPGRPPSPCIIRNYSAAGALLELNENLDPPFNLRLKMDRSGEIIDCELKHARGSRVGVLLRGDDLDGVIERALGGETRPARFVKLVGPMPRVTGRDLRRMVLQQEPQ